MQNLNPEGVHRSMLFTRSEGRQEAVRSCRKLAHPDDVVGDVDVGVVLELAWQQVAVGDEGQLNAAKVGVKNIALN